MTVAFNSALTSANLNAKLISRTDNQSASGIINFVNGIQINGEAVVAGGGTPALAWINFNGSGTVAVRASFNVDSVTDVNQGQYTINFDTALADDDYVVTVGASLASARVHYAGPLNAGGTYPLTTGDVDIFTVNDAGNAVDGDIVCVSIIGNE